MDPSNDTHYLAEAVSPRAPVFGTGSVELARSRSSTGKFLATPGSRHLRTPSPHPSIRRVASDTAPVSNADEFLQNTVRTMRYRSWVRWYHGPFSTVGSSSRIIRYHIVGCLTFFVTAYSRLAALKHRIYTPIEEARWKQMEFVVALIVGSNLLFLLVVFTVAQISHFGLISELFSSIFTVYAASSIFLGTPTVDASESHYMRELSPLLLFSASQLLVALAAIAMNLFALPLARWYILRSRYMLSNWSAEIVPPSAELDSRGGLPDSCFSIDVRTPAGVNQRYHRNRVFTVKACPYSCQSVKPNALKTLLLWRNRLNCGGISCTLSTTVENETLCCRYGCIYKGEVDDVGRPHGFGQWYEGGNPYGERLRGFWEAGHPTAPFSSRMNSFGSGFTALRLGWCRFDFKSKESIAQVFSATGGGANLPPPDRQPLREENFGCGLLDVECSIFGKFFRKFPKFVYWEFPKSSLSLRPQLGLNNRLQSFSWLNQQEPRRTHRRLTTCTRFAPPMVVSSECDSGSTSEASEDGSHVCVDSGEVYWFMRNGLSWVTDMMLPHHVPPTAPVEDPETQTVTVALDSLGSVQVPGWERLQGEDNDSSKSVEISMRWNQNGEEQRVRELCISNWQKIPSSTNCEALVFIHGYKTKLDEAPLLLGQLLALGSFPNSIKPFMFLWPAGTQVWHYFQARRASHHSLCQRALIAFLKTLPSLGFTRVHILAHSMGTRLFMNSLRFAKREKLFLENFEKSSLGSGIGSVSADPDKLDLFNLIFLHPEHYLDDFVIGGGYEMVQNYASQITIYTHAQDEALASAELLSRGRKCMGKHPFDYFRPKRQLTVRRGSNSDGPTTRSPSLFKDAERSLGEDYLCDNDLSRVTGTLGPAWDHHVGSRSLRHANQLHNQRKNYFNELPTSAVSSSTAGRQNEWLDVDVIDCTYLDANVHGLRHCFFNINASVIADLRELLTARNRAAQRRNTLELRHGNVYTFRTPPADLISIFGV